MKFPAFPDLQLHVELIRNDNIQERPPAQRGSKIHEICSENSINTGETGQRRSELEDSRRNGWKDLFGG